MVGGGRGSQVGGAHRVAACMDGLFEFSAGAVDIDPTKSRADGIGLGLSESRAYGGWREMLDAESPADLDRLDLVTVATPNATHFEIVRAFLEAEFNVLCEKPFTLDVGEAEELVRIARERKSVCGVNFGFSGYPMVRQARAMANTGENSEVKVVVMEFAHGFHARADDADNPRIRWRYDPQQAGKSAVLGDAGIHALHMGGYIIGQSIAELSADLHRACQVGSSRMMPRCKSNSQMERLVGYGLAQSPSVRCMVSRSEYSARKAGFGGATRRSRIRSSGRRSASPRVLSSAAPADFTP